MPADAGGSPPAEHIPDPAHEGKPPSRRRSSEAVRRQEKSGRDIWYYIDVLGRPVSALFAALALGMFGFFGQMALEHNQNARMYVELMSQREQAESGIRSDMFTTILSEFFTIGASGPTDISERLLQLEMLALNFGETLSLRPLFRELERDLERVRSSDDLETARPSDGMVWRFNKTLYMKRLRSLASKVTGWQLSRLSINGARFAIEVPLAKAAGDSSYVWPDTQAHRDWALNAEGSDEDQHTWIAETTERMAGFTIGGIKRSFTATFSEANPDRGTVRVSLKIVSSDQTRPTEMEFDLGYFDFPMIDNTRLSEDHRFAMVMDGFEDDYIKLVAVSFPGLYASQREKPFLNEVITQVHDQTER
ncbi:MAG: hypothetical protein O7I93_15740 [Gemmatimonadetes bacterium]|nr:hypothetical protein [Gemmatimonadota bacterium]